MKEQAEQIQNEPLFDYIGTGTLDAKQLSMASEGLPSYFRIKYGFSKSNMISRTIKHDLYLISARIKKLCPDEDYSKAPQIKEELEQRIEESTNEEFFAFYEKLANKLQNGDEEGQQLFYGKMVKPYADIRRDFT